MGQQLTLPQISDIPVLYDGPRNADHLCAPSLPFFVEQTVPVPSMAPHPHDPRQLKIEILALHGWQAFASEKASFKSFDYAVHTEKAIREQLQQQGYSDGDVKINMIGLSGSRKTFKTAVMFDDEDKDQDRDAVLADSQLQVRERITGGTRTAPLPVGIAALRNVAEGAPVQPANQQPQAGAARSPPAPGAAPPPKGDQRNKQTIKDRTRGCMEELLESGAIARVTHADVVFVVGHSQGGLVGAGIISKLYKHKFLRESQQVVLLTIATPHHGTCEAWTKYYGREATAELQELAVPSSQIANVHKRHVLHGLNNGMIMICTASYRERIVGVCSGLADGFHHPNIYRGLYIPSHHVPSGTTADLSGGEAQAESIAMQIALLGIRRRNEGHFDDILRFVTTQHSFGDDVVTYFGELLSSSKALLSRKTEAQHMPKTTKTVLDLASHSKIHSAHFVYSFGAQVWMHHFNQRTAPDSLPTTVSPSAKWRPTRIPSVDEWSGLALAVSEIAEHDPHAAQIIQELRKISQQLSSSASTDQRHFHPLLRYFEGGAPEAPQQPHMPPPVQVLFPRAAAPEMSQDAKLKVAMAVVKMVVPDCESLGSAVLSDIIVRHKFNLNNVIDAVLDAVPTN